MDSFYKSIAVVAAAAVLAVGLASADTATTKKSTTKATTTKSTVKKGTTSAAKKGATTTKRRTAVTASKSKSKSGTKAGMKTGSKPATTWHARQTQPTPERYKEIQQALVSKGYLTGEPTGTWNQQSIDALRRYQQDQKLEATGKIDSLSLIALGLGPKHETASAKPPAPPPVPPPPPTAN